MWGVDSKRVRTTFKGHNKDVRSLDVSPNNLLLITGSHRSVRIWRIRDGSSKILSTEGKLFTSVRFSPNGRYAAASNTDQFLRIWDVRSGTLVGKWNGHGEGLRSLAFSPDGKKLVSGSIVGGMKSWDIKSLRVPTRSGLSAEKNAGMIVQKNEKLTFDGHSVGLFYALTISFLLTTCNIREKCALLPFRLMVNGSSLAHLTDASVYGICIRQCDTAHWIGMWMSSGRLISAQLEITSLQGVKMVS